jgi:hypothetical protein
MTSCLRWLSLLFKVAAQLSLLIDKVYLNRILLVLDVIQFLSYCDIIFLTALAVSKTVFSKGDWFPVKHIHCFGVIRT